MALCVSIFDLDGCLVRYTNGPLHAFAVNNGIFVAEMVGRDLGYLWGLFFAHTGKAIDLPGPTPSKAHLLSFFFGPRLPFLNPSPYILSGSFQPPLIPFPAIPTGDEELFFLALPRN
ncbi:2-succinyl-5-enolpyruvyl-6-hydroxy-3-cyclohexene-1-carboxylate synthase [Striga asiatica]|uniref:2-succinyl-5-enolpyruvyl-6-hydroxy-3-cyclohexene-1-carboxylate synthase n=1 Tax=Striga asiatica TaxID=4170 RepID=A0A5A7PY27_STRAF|nr:2-succinyl-5-enolpyruvyl-6-hydroxy-3-cyclohexene-1-carboxylate synthase [Striga asiatica]